MKKILLAALFILTLFTASSIMYASDFSWVTASSVHFAKEEYHKVTASTPAPFSFLSTKQDCTEMQFTLDNGTSRDVCTVRVANGQVSSDEYVLLHGTTVARKLTSSSTKHSAFIPLRDSSKIIELKQISNKLVISIISDAYVLPPSQYGSAKYELPFMNKTEKIIQYANANIQPLSPNGVNVSKNGKWIVGEASNGFFTYEIATETFRYVKQAYKTSSIATAISNDGRYIITANKLGKFEITDTQQCESYSPQNGTSAKCGSINYFDSIKQYLPSLATDVELKKVQFDNNEQISFYATHDFVSNTEHTISKITMNMTGDTVKNYLALGDSFAAGEGAYNYRAGTDFADNRCHLSLDSYPYLLDDSNLGSVQSVACSGAKTKDYYYSDEKLYNDKLSQANRKTTEDFDEEIYINYLPGHRLQYRFVIQDKPNIVTISIGGNDIGFSKIVQTCVLSSYDCFDYYEERAAIVSSINNTYPSLVDTFTKIKEEAANNAHIYVLGYPEIAKPDGNCAVNVHLSNNEIKLGNNITAYLNSVIKMAANHAGVAYVDVTDALYGNRLCEIDSSKAAVNGLTAGDSAPIPEIGPLGSESFHPNKKGHEMYAKKIKQLTNNFNLQMPEKVQSNPNETSLSDISFVADAPVKGDSIFDTYYEDSMSEDVLYKDSTVAVQLNTDSFALRNDKEVRIELHSDPTLLGIVTPVNGAIDTSLSIPSNLGPGYHTLHIYATNIENEVIDIQKIVYVAESETDYDGDGITNENEICLVGEASGQDIDQDGIDDACDGFIDTAPPTTPEESTPPPVEIIDEQPEVISTDKVFPPSESRPEWLLIKEREIAEEQAAANQSATVTQPAETTQQQPPITTYPQQENKPEDAANTSSEETTPTTQVAGVSSAIETKEQPKSSANYWWLYLLVGAVIILFGFGVYRYMTEENKV